MKLSSPEFNSGGHLPAKFANLKVVGGKNQNPPLVWSDPPSGTKSFALSLTDPHPVAHNWVHWLVVDLPAKRFALAEGASGGGMPHGARELKNSFGVEGYGGPQPPPGSGRHPYVFRVYALDVERIDVPPDAGLERFEKALAGHIIAKAEMVGYFER
jgi:Raf kinase inhibitor-like YbhB/YbcL family protein